MANLWLNTNSTHRYLADVEFRLDAVYQYEDRIPGNWNTLNEVYDVVMGSPAYDVKVRMAQHVAQTIAGPAWRWRNIEAWAIAEQVREDSSE